MLSENAPAKINLFLHVGDKRADGFHPVQSLAVFTAMGDALSFAPAAELSLRLDGPFAKNLEAETDNLVLRAAKALASDLPGQGAAIGLTKNLPVASGIGGGSSDAAAALRGLRLLWSLPMDDAKLCEIGAGLGSDIPVCVGAAPAFMEGRGEVLRPLNGMPRLSVLLVNPGIAVSTREVFAGLQNRSGVGMALPQAGFSDTADLLRFLEPTRNDLEAPARALAPAVGAVLDAMAAMPGALLTRMSGSGATCFGLFADDACCARAAGMLQAANAGWWIAPTFVPETGMMHEASGQDIGPTEQGL
jgi:4-diphosphocytidyl-2-C-methyl-D-erythritol kinase